MDTENEFGREIESAPPLTNEELDRVFANTVQLAKERTARRRIAVGSATAVVIAALIASAIAFKPASNNDGQVAATTTSTPSTTLVETAGVTFVPTNHDVGIKFESIEGEISVQAPSVEPKDFQHHDGGCASTSIGTCTMRFDLVKEGNTFYLWVDKAQSRDDLEFVQTVDHVYEVKGLNGDQQLLLSDRGRVPNDTVVLVSGDPDKNGHYSSVLTAWRLNPNTKVFDKVSTQGIVPTDECVVGVYEDGTEQFGPYCPPNVIKAIATATLGRVYGDLQTMTGRGEVRPKTVDEVENISWSDWGSANATGHGTRLWADRGTPFSEATVQKVEIVAFDLGNCGGKYMYRAVQWYPEGEEFDPKNYLDICRGGIVEDGQLVT